MVSDKSSNTASQRAKKAIATMKRRGSPPVFESVTPDQLQILKHAYRAASAAIGRAEKNGLPYDEKWLLACHKQIVAQQFRCAATGLAFDLKAHKTKGAGGSHFAPSPDRIDPTKGYVQENVRWVLWAVNRAKGEMSNDAFVTICRAVVTQTEIRCRK